MPKYSVKHINRAWHLLMDHGYDAKGVADIMDISIATAHELIQSAAKMYDRPIDHFLKKPEPVKKMERPKAEYSNHSPYGLV